MISRSRDGDFGTAVVQSWGIGAVRASSSRGGAVGLLQMCRRLEKTDRPGQSVVAGLTVDGPRGPRHKSKPGVLALVKRSGALLVPGVTDCTPRIELRSWDRQRVPLPFSRCRVQLGRPIALRPPPAPGEDGAQLNSDAIDYRPDLTVEQLDQVFHSLTSLCALQ